MQAFVNTSFENISSTGLALDLLLQFESILQRDTLKVSTYTCTMLAGKPQDPVAA